MLLSVQDSTNLDFCTVVGGRCGRKALSSACFDILQGKQLVLLCAAEDVILSGKLASHAVCTEIKAHWRIQKHEAIAPDVLTCPEVNVEVLGLLVRGSTALKICGLQSLVEQWTQDCRIASPVRCSKCLLLCQGDELFFGLIESRGCQILHTLRLKPNTPKVDVISLPHWLPWVVYGDFHVHDHACEDRHVGPNLVYALFASRVFPIAV
mmetsp:Transcript_37610/g.66122  ORF Transcript_37610/g.66122 Transcript_37610/m.66122 type:complete len:209 (-) Transcript_37610:2355-2981(-)